VCIVACHNTTVQYERNRSSSQSLDTNVSIVHKRIKPPFPAVAITLTWRRKEEQYGNFVFSGTMLTAAAGKVSLL
jgi:hypothetical protein